MQRLYAIVQSARVLVVHNPIEYGLYNATSMSPPLSELPDYLVSSLLLRVFEISTQ